VYLLFGQYGPYVQLGQVSDEVPKPKRASLPRGPNQRSSAWATPWACSRLPRLLGEHPDGGKIQAGLGRFGPYVVHDKGKGEKDYRSLKAEDDVLLVALDRAIELLATPERKAAAAAPPSRTWAHRPVPTKASSFSMGPTGST
jgi:DNA topoisomerase-1